MLRILGRVSSLNVRKVLWTCTELGLPFEREDWGAGFRTTQSPEYLALNPNALVPVLIDDDFVLWESNSICRYLASKAGRVDLLPAAPRPRALVERWMDWQATDLNTAWRYAFLALVRSTPGFADAAQVETSVGEWNRLMGILDQALAAGGPYVNGAAFSLADVVLGLSVHRWRSTPMPHAELPAVAAYYMHLARHPGFVTYGRDGPA
jgi:glutathione S-transferase